MDSLMYCKTKLTMKTPKIAQVLDLLQQCKKTLMQLLNHEQIEKILQELARLRRLSVRGREELTQTEKKHFKLLGQQSYFLKIAISLLTVCGSLLNSVGELTQCEQCYSLYVAIVESVEGSNSLQAAQCYFWLAQFYAEEPYCIDKVKVCFLKCKDIHEYFFGVTDCRVADCLFNLGLAYKRHLLLPQAQTYIQEALKVYQEGVGTRSLPVANSLLILGKIALMRGYQIRLALRYFEESLAIKQEIFKNKPKCHVLNAIQLLIWGTK